MRGALAALLGLGACISADVAMDTPTSDFTYTDGAPYSVRSWRGSVKGAFPEDEFLKDRSETAISFSGGGGRAYLAATGYLAGLHKTGLMDHVKYIGGISGGNWAMWNYMYQQLTTDDSELLGPLVEPQDITYADLEQMSAKCMRGAAKTFFLELCAELILLHGRSIDHAWTESVQQVYLDYAGIGAGKLMGWSADHVKEVVARNPTTLTAGDFILPCDASRPFPIAGISLLGPEVNLPYLFDDRNTSFIESTPLYTGMPALDALNMKYDHGKYSLQIGGAIESFAFGGAAASAPLPANETSGILSVPQTSTGPFTLNQVASASSFAPGIVLADLPSSLAKYAVMPTNYFSPLGPAAVQQTQVVVTDGGTLQDVNLISFLLRGVKNIILFSASSGR